MNIVLLSPHFPPNYYQFAVALRRRGAQVLAIGDAPFGALRGELQRALNEYYGVDTLHDYGQLLRACGYFTYRYGRLDRLESHNEYWLETDARLRTDFNVFGPKTADMAHLKRKSKMKQVFARAGIATAQGKVVKTLKAAQAFIEAVGYPVIAKPDIGVGAAATYKLRNAEELARFFAAKPAVDYFMEEFISGDLFSFDGLVDREGQIVFYTSHYFNRGIMEAVNDNLDMYYYSLRALPPDLEEAGFKTVAAFGLRERFFHIEFFRTPERLLALELNMRPPGGLTMDMFNFANDANLYQAWADLVVQGRMDSTFTRPYHCAHVGRKGHLPYGLSHEAVLREYGALLVHHEPISPVLAPAIGDYGYLLRSPELATLQAAIDGILAQG